MSGGSWRYEFSRLQDLAIRLNLEKDPLRRAMSTKVQQLSKAMHDIEWVDSDDYSPGDEIQAINEFLEPEKTVLVLSILRAEAKELIKEFQKYL
jgi:Mg/Co/Ni transporter MgtE